MSYKVHFKDESSSLSHHGVKGRKWGVRRYQNEDGSLTLLGKKKYGVLEGWSVVNNSDVDCSNVASGVTSLTLRRR